MIASREKSDTVGDRRSGSALLLAMLLEAGAAVDRSVIGRLEGQLCLDVLVVRGGNGDGAALLRCSRDVLRAEVGEFAAIHAHGA